MIGLKKRENDKKFKEGEGGEEWCLVSGKERGKKIKKETRGRIELGF